MKSKVSKYQALDLDVVWEGELEGRLIVTWNPQEKRPRYLLTNLPRPEFTPEQICDAYLRPEHDLDFSKGERGKYDKRLLKEGSNVLLRGSIAVLFPALADDRNGDNTKRRWWRGEWKEEFWNDPCEVKLESKRGKSKAGPSWVCQMRARR